jgi:hypothetical protein
VFSKLTRDRKQINERHPPNDMTGGDKEIGFENPRAGNLEKLYPPQIWHMPLPHKPKQWQEPNPNARIELATKAGILAIKGYF